MKKHLKLLAAIIIAAACAEVEPVPDQDPEPESAPDPVPEKDPEMQKQIDDLKKQLKEAQKKNVNRQVPPAEPNSDKLIKMVNEFFG